MICIQAGRYLDTITQFHCEWFVTWWKGQGANLGWTIPFVLTKCFPVIDLLKHDNGSAYLCFRSHLIFALQSKEKSLRSKFDRSFWIFIKLENVSDAFMLQKMCLKIIFEGKGLHQWTMWADSFAVSREENRNRVWGESTPGVPINQGPSAPYVHQTIRDWMIQIPGG